MKSSLLPLLAALGLTVLPLGAATVNDGTTTNGLSRLANALSQGTADLVTSPDGTLTASARGLAGIAPVLLNAWYAQSLVPTGTTYTVSADFKPADPTDLACQGGVAGWLGVSSATALTLTVVPTGGSSGFHVSFVNLASGSASDAHLYQTNGEPVSANPAAA